MSAAARVDSRTKLGTTLRGSIPVIQQVPANISAADRQASARVARRLLADEPALHSVEPFGPRLATGLGPWPCLLLEDHSAITSIQPAEAAMYAYRALLLAGDGDLMLLDTPRNPSFERYCRKLLKLGKVKIWGPKAARARSLALRCAGDEALLLKIAARARASGGLNLVPYMGTGGVWRLAGAIAARSGTEVRVAAPPPRLTRRANEKLWFAERVAELFGRHALPAAYSAFNLIALVRRLKLLAKHHPNVAVKLLDSSSSEGNFVFDSARIGPLSLGAACAEVQTTLRRAGWRGGFPLMVTGWESPVLASPSVQLWIPEPAVGLPIVEGVFDQLLVGTVARFGGAAPSALPARWVQCLADEAVRLGYLLQELGYFGRCSFDAIILGDDLAKAQLHWIECNGRWGGVSIPLTLANRLVGNWTRRPFVVIDHVSPHAAPQDLTAFLDRMQTKLFIPGVRDTGMVVLSPLRIETGTGLMLMVLGESAADARAEAEAITARFDETHAPAHERLGSLA